MGAEPVFVEIGSRLRRAVRNGTGVDLEPRLARALKLRIGDLVDEAAAEAIVSRGATAPFDIGTLASGGEGVRCFIYFVRSPCGAIKIGKAVDLDRRLSQLQGANPARLRLLASLEGPASHERTLHDPFWADRIRGEWFRPSPSLLHLIAEIAG